MSTLLSTIHVLYMMIKHTVRVNFVTLFVTVLTQLSVVTHSDRGFFIESVGFCPVTPRDSSDTRDPWHWSDWSHSLSLDPWVGVAALWQHCRYGTAAAGSTTRKVD